LQGGERELRIFQTAKKKGNWPDSTLTLLGASRLSLLERVVQRDAAGRVSAPRFENKRTAVGGKASKSRGHLGLEGRGKDKSFWQGRRG